MGKDYYVILGVESGASFEEIRNAFRRRALELHPDHSGRDSGPFLELQEAYAVLSDRERRHGYEHEIQTTQQQRTPRRSEAEPLRAAQGGRFRDMSISESFETFTPSLDELMERLWRNFEPAHQPKSGHIESLTVEVVLTPEEAQSGGAASIRIPARVACPACAGRGHVSGYLCWRCEGQGVFLSEATIEVEYPPTIADAYAARVPLNQFGIENFYLTVLFRVGTEAQHFSPAQIRR